MEDHPPLILGHLQGPTLPRSIRWRMQLGQLKYQESEIGWTIEELNTYNREFMKQQRTIYQGLCENYEMERGGILPFENNFVVQQDKSHDNNNNDNDDNDLDQPDHHDKNNDTNNNNNHDDDNDNIKDDAINEVDPLTMMVMDIEKEEKKRQDLDLKYRKERALRKRGATVETLLDDDSDGDRFDTYSSTLTLGVIEKDLNRLQPDHHTYHHSRKNYQSPGREILFDDSKRERSKVLTEILHVYAREHPHIGYRQGMHEIASYLLLTLEMDMFDQESALEQLPPAEGGELLDTHYLAADAYHMLKCVMSSLQGAYDVKQHSTDASPMEAMAKSILSKVKDTACDKILYDHVTRMNCPPELYCTRWVRLMFSREVEGWRNVLVLWDIIFDLISLDGTISSMIPSRYTRPGISPPLTLGEFPLMQVLEAAAASMILLQRSQLLSAEDPNESIHTLMNVPPLKNILPLTATLLSMMRRIQLKDSKNTSTDNSTVEESRSHKPSRTATILQSAQNAIRDISLGTVSPATFRLGLKAETVLTTRSEIPAVPTLEESNNHWRGSLRKLSFPKQEPAPQSPTPLRTVARPHVAADNILTRSEMAMTLNQGIFTIRNFLTSLETVAGSVPTNVVPQSVWTALEEVDTVRQDLLVERPEPKKGLKGHTV